jgi:hypothetical protein
MIFMQAYNQVEHTSDGLSYRYQRCSRQAQADKPAAGQQMLRSLTATPAPDLRNSHYNPN